MKMKFVIGLLVVLSLSACSSASPSPTAQAELPADTATSLPPPAATSTPLPSLTPTITPSPTATPSYFVRDGTPVPQPPEAISPENVSQIAELARWGDGRVIRYFQSADSELDFAQTPLGVIAYYPETNDILWRFDSPAGVQSIDFKTSINLIAIGDTTGGVWILNILTGQVIYHWQAHSKSVGAISISDTENVVTSASGDGTIEVWSLEDASLIHSVPKPDSFYYNLETVDDRLLYWDSTQATLYELGSGEIVFHHDSRVLGLFPEASMFVTSDPISLRLFETGSVIQTFSSGIGESNQILSAIAVALSPDQSKLAIGFTNQIRTDVWKISSGEKIYEFVSPSNDKPPVGNYGDGAGPYYVAGIGFSLDGTTLTVVSGQSDVDYWDLNTGQLLRNESTYSVVSNTIPIFPKDASSLQFSFNSEWLASNSYLWNIKTYSEKRATEGIELIGFSSNSQYVYGYDNNQQQLIRVLETSTLENVRNIFLPPTDITVCYFCGITSAADNHIAPDESFYAESEFEGGYRLWDLEKNIWISPLDFDLHLPRDLDFSSDGNRLLVVEAYGSELQVMDLETREVVHWLKAPGALLFEAEFSQNNNLVAAAGVDFVVVWNLDEEGTPPHFLTPTEDASSITQVTISSTGDLVAADVGGGRINIWRVSDSELLITVYAHFDSIKDLTFSPDGRFLATASSDGTVRLWGIPPN